MINFCPDARKHVQTVVTDLCTTLVKSASVTRALASRHDVMRQVARGAAVVRSSCCRQAVYSRQPRQTYFLSHRYPCLPRLPLFTCELDKGWLGCGRPQASAVSLSGRHGSDTNTTQAADYTLLHCTPPRHKPGTSFSSLVYTSLIRLATDETER